MEDHFSIHQFDGSPVQSIGTKWLVFSRHLSCCNLPT